MAVNMIIGKAGSNQCPVSLVNALAIKVKPVPVPPAYSFFLLGCAV
jgi:hypothetical protein